MHKRNSWAGAPVRKAGEAGSATLIALVAITVLGGVSVAMLALTTAAERESRQASASVRAGLIAEAGVADAVQQLARAEAQRVAQGGDVAESAQQACVGSCDAPRTLGGASYWAEVASLGDGFFRVLSTGEYDGDRRRLEVVISRVGSPVYENALFAGNSSGDPNYVLDFGGSGSHADQINGDVYSGGRVRVRQQAEIHGVARATGVIEGHESGAEGVVLPIPDLAAMDYAHHADVDVAHEFATGNPTWTSDDAGGKAYQLASSNPAHIFRKNPNDRGAETGSTVKDDYFLEDPYEKVRADSKENGSDPFKVSLGTKGSRVFYIDGNLWLHNTKTHSFQLTASGKAGVQVTFVVKGNIYFSDNLFLEDDKKDGVAFIALGDSNVADSGNIYFGDTMFGTLREMNAFMYAENDFVDNGLDASGSKYVRVHGNMTAGNHVRIQRDHGNAHSRLTVDFDPRVSEGSLSMPGLPKSQEAAGATLSVVSWREVGAD